MKQQVQKQKQTKKEEKKSDKKVVQKEEKKEKTIVKQVDKKIVKKGDKTIVKKGDKKVVKKGDKKTKKPDEGEYTLITPKPLEEIEVDDMEQVMGDKMIEDLSKISVKKLTSTKEKTRRVQEFKFRVLDLVAILVEQTKQPETFSSLLPTLTSIISKLQKDNNHQNYLQRIVKIVISFINRYKLTAEIKIDELNLSLQEILKSVNRCNNKQLNSQFSLIYELILRTLVGLGKAGRKIALPSLKELLLQYSFKKNTMITEKFIKKVIGQCPFAASSLFKNLCQSLHFDSQLKERKRPELLRLLDYIITNPNLISGVFDEKHSEKSIVALKEATLNIMTNINNQKQQKVGTFRKVILCVQKAEEYLKTKSIVMGDEIQEQLKAFTNDDQDLVRQAKKFIKQQ